MIIFHCLTVVFAGQLAKGTYSKDFSAPFFLVYFRYVYFVIFSTVYVLVIQYLYIFLLQNSLENGDFPRIYGDEMDLSTDAVEG